VCKCWSLGVCLGGQNQRVQRAEVALQEGGERRQQPGTRVGALPCG
jgi:hypothetical protein